MGFHHWSRLPSFSAVWPCVKLFHAGLLLVTWTWIKGASFNSSFSFLHVYSELCTPQSRSTDSFWNHILLLSLLLLYPPCPPTPRCLEHDDSKNSKIDSDLFRSHCVCSINCHANEQLQRLAFMFIIPCVKLNTFFLPHVERTLHHALSYLPYLPLCDGLWKVEGWVPVVYKLSPRIITFTNCPLPNN